MTVDTEPHEAVIRYVAVARLQDHLPVARYAPVDTAALPASGFEEKVTRVLRSRRVAAHSRLTITDNDVGCIHFDSLAPCMYLIVTPPKVPQRVAFQFLAELAHAFEPAFGTAAAAAPPGARPWGLSAKSEGLLAKITAPYNAVAAEGLSEMCSSSTGSMTIHVDDDDDDEEVVKEGVAAAGKTGGRLCLESFMKRPSYAGDSPRAPSDGGMLTPRSLLVALSNEAFADSMASKFSWWGFLVCIIVVLLLVIGVPSLVVLCRR
ncbi:hypothetical protein BU14_1552s0001 [Porphyra umbilicalis]|uniref:Longin domain-containing protein n=1 Tax=Porphyra umbilicalis TaxID=2786 RepID=A0A1X6NLB0_PORUM|nr:hypothetical protein BU14_1552s0001 [Porphyra umbilicalis]|eukprot:OSX69395.1 hypothetical protein BU14_1552s0001 [Porphyra umbilicalis]